VELPLRALAVGYSLYVLYVLARNARAVSEVRRMRLTPAIFVRLTTLYLAGSLAEVCLAGLFLMETFTRADRYALAFLLAVGAFAFGLVGFVALRSVRKQGYMPPTRVF
jgi:hypothetical protein